MIKRSLDAVFALAALGLCAVFVPSFGSVLPDDAAGAMSTLHAPGHMLMRGGGMRGGGGGGMRGGSMGGGGMRAGGGGGYSRGGEFGGGSRDLRSSASNNVNFSGNRNINVNNNVNVNRNYNGNIGGACYGGCYNRGWDHPVAAAAAVGAAAAVTAAAIGSVAYSIPPDCVMTGGYYQCGSTWYQPQYQGTDVQYVVVNAPQ